MPGHHDPAVGSQLVEDDPQRRVELFVVHREVGGEVRRVVRLPRSPAFSQVDSIERVPAVDEEVGERLVEEVVGEPVDVEHCAARG